MRILEWSDWVLLGYLTVGIQRQIHKGKLSWNEKSVILSVSPKRHSHVYVTMWKLDHLRSICISEPDLKRKPNVLPHLEAYSSLLMICLAWRYASRTLGEPAPVLYLPRPGMRTSKSFSSTLVCGFSLTFQICNSWAYFYIMIHIQYGDQKPWKGLYMCGHVTWAVVRGLKPEGTHLI